jgi:protease I
VQGFEHNVPGQKVPVDVSLNRAREADYDALVLPGGVRNPDSLRTEPKAVQLVRSFFEHGKPVAAICHGPWMLAEAEVIKGRTLTSWPSLKTDLIHAGARWVDEEVVVNGILVTSRKPADIPAFNQKMIDVFQEAGTRAQPAA